MDHGGPPAGADDLVFRDRALVVDDVLVLADLHLGKGAASRLELPVGNGSDVVERVQRLLEAVEPTTLVLAGDVLHSFGTVPHTIGRALDGVVDAARTRDVEVAVLEGNHDAMLEAVWDGDVRREYPVGDTVVCHGDVEPAADAARYVIGHDHPTIELEGRRRPCYLVGEAVYEGATVVVLPAFSRLPRGVAVNRMGARDFQSPLVSDADALAPVVWDDDADDALAFPPLGSFRHRL